MRLSKRITGATAAETRARMADIDRAALPSVDEAQGDAARGPSRSAATARRAFDRAAETASRGRRGERTRGE